jgi:hypothetical protein
MFSKSVLLDGLNYDLGSDEDLVLFQKVEFVGGDHLTAGSGKKYAYATKPFSSYNIMLLYSIGAV